MSGSALDSVSPELRPVCHWSVAVIVIVGQRSGPVTQHAAHTLTPGNRMYHNSQYNKTRAANDPSALNNHGEGPSRGLLRDCTTSPINR